MSKSRARLAADWFAKLRVNAQTQEVEHADVATVEAEVVAVSDAVSSQLASGIDADTLDGNHASAFALASHGHTGLLKGGDIGGGANLNSYTTDGYYHQNANANAASGSNYPIALAGMLEVMSDGSMVYQRYTVYNSDHNVYVRTYYSGTWYGWTRVGTMDVTTLSNVAGSRSNNTWYRNTTGKPLIVSIQTTGWNGRVLVGPSTASYTEVSKNSAGGSGAYEQDNHTFVVPNNWYYYYVGGNRNQWVEYS